MSLGDLSLQVIKFPDWMIREPDRSFLFEVPNDEMFPLLKKQDFVLAEYGSSSELEFLHNILVLKDHTDGQIKIRRWGTVDALIFIETASGNERRFIAKEDELLGHVIYWISSNLK